MTAEARIDLTFRSAEQAKTDDDFNAMLDVFQDALLDIDRDDIDLVASLANRTASLVVFDVDPNQPGFDRFWSDVRTALHVAGVATPGWEKMPHATWVAEQSLQFA